MSEAAAAAADRHLHLLPVKAVVQFPAELEEMTVTSLAELPATAEAWKKMRAVGPPPGERIHLEQWQATHDAAVELLSTSVWAEQQVAVYCELQVLLDTAKPVRKAMEEVMRVVDATDGNQLFAELVKSAYPTRRSKRSGSTENLLVASAAGMITTVKRLLDSNSDPNLATESSGQ